MPSTDQQSDWAFDPPPFPDYPDSPLSGWQHHGLLDYAGRRVQKELERVKYTGCLMKIGISYTLVDQYNGAVGKVYEMTFGDSSPNDSSAQDAPLSDGFLSELHDQLSRYIHKNVSNYSGRIETALAIMLSEPVYAIIIVCRIVISGECDQGHENTTKKCKKSGNSWKCLHTNCS
jgi:hypothetical protein